MQENVFIFTGNFFYICRKIFLYLQENVFAFAGKFFYIYRKIFLYLQESFFIFPGKCFYICWKIFLYLQEHFFIIICVCRQWLYIFSCPYWYNVYVFIPVGIHENGFFLFFFEIWVSVYSVCKKFAPDRFSKKGIVYFFVCLFIRILDKIFVVFDLMVAFYG